MFAVVKTGGKQYKVSPGDTLKVERLEGEAGQHIDLSSVLLINDAGKIFIGAPLLEKAQIRASIVEQTRGDKILVFKKKRRQGYRRMAGHRQDLTVIRIEEIFPQGAKSNTVTPKPSKIEEKKISETEKPVVKTAKPTLKEKPAQKVEGVKKDPSSPKQEKKMIEKKDKKPSSLKKEK